MALILSSLRDGGELSLMNGDNNHVGINLPRLWLLFLSNVNTYPVTSRSDDSNNHHSSKVGQLQRHKSQLVIVPPEAAGTKGGKSAEKEKRAS